KKGLLQDTPESVAQFLHKGEGLNKTAIGDYLGERNDFNEQVLQAFVELHDFTDLILVKLLIDISLGPGSYNNDVSEEAHPHLQQHKAAKIKRRHYSYNFHVMDNSINGKGDFKTSASYEGNLQPYGCKKIPRRILQFLWSFRLPGEAQKIDRMMECFAKRYCDCQGDNNIFENSDTCYVLSFAIIMLNTSLHNPSVKEKPTIEQFINMNRGINQGQDLPRELLVSLYDSIKAEPFKIPEDDGNDLMHTFFNPDKEGWLWKQGGRYKSWKRRWFILNDNCLYYFEYTTDKEPRGIIPLENISIRECTDRQKQHCFELYASGGADFIKACKTDSEGKVVEGKHTVYRMSASGDEERKEWMQRLTQSISHNPFYDMLANRKRKAQLYAKN
ncbi:hypothetical protein NQ314_012029, partial [Rhamnusium bicolor]